REATIGPFAAQRRAAHVLAFPPLNLDDVGPEQRELVARIGASQHLREVENLHAFERSGHASFSWGPCTAYISSTRNGMIVASLVSLPGQLPQTTLASNFRPRHVTVIFSPTTGAGPSNRFSSCLNSRSVTISPSRRMIRFTQ